jgi:hypothetical protein
MGDQQSASGFIRDPRAWAEDCRARVASEPDPEVKAALLQLAEEFDAAASEIEGLITAFEVVSTRKDAA